MTPPERLLASLAEASARRREIAAVTTAYRLIDDAADGCPGVVVDIYGEWAVLSVFEEAPIVHAQELADVLVGFGIRGVYLKVRPRTDLRRRAVEELAATTPVAGEPAPEDLAVSEHGMLLQVLLGDGLSTGLFTDQRDNRVRIRQMTKGARVLNLFAYTCSFTVAAALGGATETVSVDLSQRALDRGRDNLDRNGVWGPTQRLVRADALAFVARMSRRDSRFDVIILDPPSFGTRTRGTFSVEKDYATVAGHAMTALGPNGSLLAVTNHRKTTLPELVSLLRNAAQGDRETPRRRPHRAPRSGRPRQSRRGREERPHPKLG